MDTSVTRVNVIPGQGVVARAGNTVIVAGPTSESAEAAVESLIGLAAEHANGRGLLDTARDIGGIANSGVDLAFAVLLDCTCILVAGDAHASVEDDAEGVEVSGRDAVTYVDRILPAGAASVTLALGSEAGAADRFSRLDGGVIRGDGAVISLTTTDDDAPEAVDELPEASGEEFDFEPIELTTTGDVLEDADEPIDQIDLSSPPVIEADSAPDRGDAVDADADAVQVDGVLCEQGHFSPPQNQFCTACGAPIDADRVARRPRPPLGALVSDDGSTYLLTNDVTLGREPESADDVASGAATALRLEDTGLALSRVHARIVLDGWDVRVVDANSANGTYILAPGAGEWLRLEPGVPTTITLGTKVTMGGRVLTFEAS